MMGGGSVWIATTLRSVSEAIGKIARDIAQTRSEFSNIAEKVIATAA